MSLNNTDSNHKSPGPVSKLVGKYLRTEHLPHIWCPGCGNGIVMHDVIRAVDRLGLERDRTVIVSGIGCSARAAGYMDFNTMHTTHGRAIAFATGIKLADPSLEVIVIAGDGDIAAIGGNHLIHAARRNIGLTVVVMNNYNYGMTGGQYSPTTPQGEYGTTAPYGTLERPFDIVALSVAAGATYAARGSTYHVRQTISMIEDGIRNPGFSVIDIACQCPTYYGRKNHRGQAVEMMMWQRDHAVMADAAAEMSPEELRDKLVIGTVHKEQYPEFAARSEELVRMHEQGSR